MKNKIFPLFLTIILLIIFFIFYKGLQNSNIYTPKLDLKQDIPIFKVNIFETDNEINSDTIFKKEKFYLLNIWASWCLPCRDEHQFLIDLRKNKSLEIVGLNYKDKKKNANSFLKELKNPYNVILSDEDGTIAIEWGAYGVPESFLIYDKKIIKKIIGPINQDIMVEIINLIR
mgnify:CR=1 FL=1|tara:strand:- start:587 stop:1105 length:519 start_codon:yes stop_codon:yes gene_type:complete